MKKTMTVMTMVIALVMSTMAMAVARGPHDKATGTVDWIDGSFREYSMTFDAHDGAPGAQEDRGTVYLTRQAATVTVALNCVRVEGDQAWFSGYVTNYVGGAADWGNTETFVEGETVTMWVKDDATPSSDGGVNIGRTWNPNYTCVDDWTGQGSVTDGNLRVHSSTD